MKVGTRLEIDRFLDMLGVFAEFEIISASLRQKICARLVWSANDRNS
jgi:hypothetical protein